MTDRIAQALTKLFERHRIIFWYDAKQELRDEFESWSYLEWRSWNCSIMSTASSTGYCASSRSRNSLLYREGLNPADLDNWLLDVQLA